jgi:hypothetical protein
MDVEGVVGRVQARRLGAQALAVARASGGR